MFLSLQNEYSLLLYLLCLPFIQTSAEFQIFCLLLFCEKKKKMKCSCNLQVIGANFTRDVDSVRVKCIPRAIKASSNKHSHPRNETMKPPISDDPRTSSAGAGCLQPKAHGTSKDGSKRVTDPSSGKRPSKRLDSVKEEEMLVKIEDS